ncbi:efflux RND transporter periplasmic adaptor subunit [Echinicola sp. CAU 1574]|uniref:Efflux RND transporter periplasmic adaptor subunit n=1 Tax=Echinicola arenosa TaxID=2774144 RepID=A0ABR9AKL2_9BACT|nr:efflux RND transporter periplasmic adaptor subunit [Echinicola arenosa]MBD8489342.1 efflux RND transporter periplasmic adaptor subunit [Echinicola arenosa]
MNRNTYISIFSLIVMAFGSGCNSPQEAGLKSKEIIEEEHGEIVLLSDDQVNSLKLTIDKVREQGVATYVEANGELEVPPQNEASITAYIGANVAVINVIEGDYVNKGQVLARLSHPELIKLQTAYQQDWNRLKYLEKENSRQETLYEKEVGSGRDLQKIQSDLAALKGQVNGLRNQLKLLGIEASVLENGEVTEQVPVKSSISGYIKKVNIKTGQYVAPQFEMFEVVNIEHIHADLMVFEKDVHLVEKGQKVRFSVQTVQNEELQAEVYAVGKSFEQEPKAVHIHAEIENKKGLLIPGMYVRGQVLVGEQSLLAVREGALVKEGNEYFIFSAQKLADEWSFEPVPVKVGVKDGNWSSINFVNPEDAKKEFVIDNAYYIMAEMKKGEGGHHH